MKIKNPLTHKKGTPDSEYSKELAELQDALRDVVSLYAAEKLAVTQLEEALSASREKQALLLERVAEIAARAASTVCNGSEAGAGVSNGMQVYYTAAVLVRSWVSLCISSPCTVRATLTS